MFSTYAIFHVNIRSMQKIFEKLKHLLHEINHEFSIICITETWASEENGIPLNNNSNFQLPNYKIIDLSLLQGAGRAGCAGCRIFLNYRDTHDFTD